MDSSYIKSNWKSWLFGLLFLAIAAIAIANLVTAVQAKNKPRQKDTSNIINTNSKPGSVTKPKLGAVLAAVGDTPALPYTYDLTGGGGVIFTVPVTINSAVTAESLTTTVQNTIGNLVCTSLTVTNGAVIGAGTGTPKSGLQVGNSSTPSNSATLNVFGTSTFDGTSSFIKAANFAEGATFGTNVNTLQSGFTSSGVLQVGNITPTFEPVAVSETSGLSNPVNRVNIAGQLAVEHWAAINTKQNPGQNTFTGYDGANFLQVFRGTTDTNLGYFNDNGADYGWDYGANTPNNIDYWTLAKF